MIRLRNPSRPALVPDTKQGFRSASSPRPPAPIFGQHRVNIIKFAGGVVTQQERDGFALMWRWISPDRGQQPAARTHPREEFALQSREHPVPLPAERGALNSPRAA
ncbi:hypothetical protein HBB16_13580 [Pseudonocardia sp. MCCB 268]|nr:hypothetical protein [Pseudonocardia cytotoxica]